MNGHTYRTDSFGHAPLEAGSGGDLDVVARGFLGRQTRVSSGAGRITLWPVGPGYDSEYIRTILYKPSGSVRNGPSHAPDQPLQRITAARVAIVLSRELRADWEAVVAHQRAVAEVNAATEERVLFVLASRPSEPVVFDILIDPGLPWVAAAFRDLRGHAVAGGRIAFQSAAAARDPRFVAHELGHALGLQHSLEPTDMMYYSASEASPLSFTPNEKLTVRLLLQRPPGNAYPDNDRVPTTDVTAAGATSVALN